MVNKKLVAAGVVMSIFAGSLVGCGGSSEEGNGGELPHGQAHLRRRGIRKNRDCCKSGLQGSCRQQAGSRAGTYYHTLAPALQHLPQQT